MPIRIVRQVTFLVVMVLAAVVVAGGIGFIVTYKQGGVFDSGFRSKMSLSKMDLRSEKVIDDLSSLTVYMMPEKNSPGEDDPSSVLREAGKSISKASRDSETSSQVVNVDFQTDSRVDGKHVDVKFRFNASTSVDYNDDVYDRTVGIISYLEQSGSYSSIDIESTPTPDGGRSYTLITEMKDSRGDSPPLTISNTWDHTLRSMSRFVGDDGNISSAKLNIGKASISADFFDATTFDRASNMDKGVFTMIDAVRNGPMSDSIVEANFNLSAISDEDSALTVTLLDETTEADLEKTTASIISTIKRAGVNDIPWPVLVTVEGNTDLSKVVFGSAVTL